MNFKGFYINLNSENFRRENLIKHLIEVKLYDKYERFEAISPNTDSKLFGLKTPGEYGLWLTIIKLLKNIPSVNDQEFFHIIEDDFRFNNSSINDFKNLLNFLVKSTEDIVFLDYLIDIPLLNLISLISKDKRELSENSQIKYSASYFYKGSTSSFIIRKSSAAYLSILLDRIFNNLKAENRLQPIDMVIRGLFQKGLLKGSICVPPLGAPDWNMDKFSSIQTDRLNSVIKSMRTHVLFRCAASGLNDPEYCAKEINKLFKINTKIKDIKNLEDFYKFIDKNKKILNTSW